MAPNWRLQPNSPLAILMYLDSCHDFYKNLSFHPPSLVGCNESVIRLVWDRYCCQADLSCQPSWFDFGTYRGESAMVELVSHRGDCRPSSINSTAFPDYTFINSYVKVNSKWVQRNEYRAITLSCGFAARKLAIRTCNGYDISARADLLYQQLYSYFNYVNARRDGCGPLFVGRPPLLFGTYDLRSNVLFQFFRLDDPNPIW